MKFLIKKLKSIQIYLIVLLICKGVGQLEKIILKKFQKMNRKLYTKYIVTVSLYF